LQTNAEDAALMTNLNSDQYLMLHLQMVDNADVVVVTPTEEGGDEEGPPMM
jgi:hypothetical protein